MTIVFDTLDNKYIRMLIRMIGTRLTSLVYQTSYSNNNHYSNMTVLPLIDVLSMGFDCLEDKNIRIVTRVIGNSYYTRSIRRDNNYYNKYPYRQIEKTIDIDMINDRDIVPLYRTIYKIWESILSSPDMEVILLKDRFSLDYKSIVMLILKYRLKNRDWQLEDGGGMIIVTDGMTSVYLSLYPIKGDTERVTDTEWFLPPKVTESEMRNVPKKMLLSGSDIPRIYTYDVELLPADALTALSVRNRRALEGIASYVLDSVKNTTPFSSIPRLM